MIISPLQLHIIRAMARGAVLKLDAADRLRRKDRIYLSYPGVTTGRNITKSTFSSLEAKELIRFKETRLLTRIYELTEEGRKVVEQ